MYCTNCGNEIVEGSKFCSQCGTPVVAPAPKAAPPISEPDTKEAAAPTVNEEVVDAEAVEHVAAEISEGIRKPSFDEFQWNVSDYPDRNAAGKTEEVDFNWNAAPVKEPEPEIFAEPELPVEPQKVVEQEEILSTENLESAIFGEKKEADPEAMSAAERIDKFYTFNRKNEEFQQLLDREYNKVKSGNAIENELSQAEERASERFEARPLNTTMEEFLESEGVVKPYQPKAFESDVLERIEAQEAEKEAKRLEEEARLAALEEARKEAEAKKLAEEKAAAEAARLEEIAKAKAAEEARLAEEARIKAEEARIKAEEEARIRAEEEAKAKAEAEARAKAEAEARVKAEEEARLRAEADLKAAREAAKIRAQQEARLAAKEEEKFRAEQERRRLAEIEAQRKLEEERQRITSQANQAVAEEEARKVLEQTARMKEEEAAKIKAAVAGLRADTMAEKALKKTPPVRKEVEEAHRATRTQIDEMAKARDQFFAELEENDREKANVTGRDTMLTNDLSKTRMVDKKAILEGLRDDTTVVSKQEIKEGLVKGAAVAAAAVEDEDDAFFNSLDAAAEANPIDFNEETLEDVENAMNPVEEPQEFVEEYPEELPQEEFVAPEPAVEELTFEEINDFEDLAGIGEPEVNDLENTQVFAAEDFEADPAVAESSALQDTVVMQKDEQLDAFAADTFDNYGEEEAQNYIQHQAELEATKEYNSEFENNPALNEFYADDFYDDEDEQLTKKERKQREKEARRLEKQRAKAEKASRKGKKKPLPEVDFGDDDFEDEKSGGKGRIVLKVVLVLLIIILAAEIVGMGIKFIAPQSKAAEFIDSQLNKVIQLITGEDTEYSVIAAQVRVNPMDDKTDLITAQMGKDRSKNIKSITYNAELCYDKERDGKVSDLVLSQPMTEVEWGRDKDNYPVYFDEQVVGKIIGFESQLYNYMNGKNDNVLKGIDPDTELYKQIVALKGKKPAGEFSKLEIGEIRQAGSNYYVWVRETIGDTQTEKVYSMYPEKEFVLKMAACYDIK